MNQPNRNPIGQVCLGDGSNVNADTVIANCQSIHAQGVVVWDVEGCDYPHPITYQGDPRYVHPRNEPIIDAYFGRLRMAGLRVGVCIRHTVLNNRVIPSTFGAVAHVEVLTAGTMLAEKITYARNRWGCNLFYVDSAASLPADVWVTLGTTFPDCLIMPEQSYSTDAYSNSYRYVAPFHHINNFQYMVGTPLGSVRSNFPNALSCVYIGDDTGNAIAQYRPQIVAAVKGDGRNHLGDLLMARVWFAGAAELATIPGIYADAGKPLPA